MGGNADKVKGRIKQTIGALVGDEKLKRDGKRDERAGSTKQKADDAVDVVRDKLEKVAETLSPGEKEK
ncbi:MAG: CsbD family protein [Actinomycetota bacterium]